MFEYNHLRRIAFWGLSCLIVAGMLDGCTKSDVSLAPVTGEVTLDGEPVRGVFIIFQPPNGKPAYAMLDAEGKFRLQYNVKNMGAIVGAQEVFLRPPGQDELGELPSGVEKPTSIPSRYRRPFETVQVASGANSFKFELKK